MADFATLFPTAGAPDSTQTASTTVVPSSVTVLPAPRTTAMLTTGRNGVTVARDVHGRLLPGNTPNPKGREAGLARRVREIVDFDKAIETLVEIAWGKLAPASKVADRIKAIELLFDRGHGKAQQLIDIKDPTSGAGKTYRTMDTPKLIATVEALRRVASGDSDASDEVQ